MTIIQGLKKILKGERPPIDVWHYFLGHYRYWLWYGGYWSKKYEICSIIRKSMIRRHIKEQIEHRIRLMNPACYNSGSCVKCGCEVLHLQMCNKGCEGYCYPSMLNKERWKKYISGGTLSQSNGTWIFIETLTTKDGKTVHIEPGKHIFFKENLLTFEPQIPY